jgi:hypothetical protein
MIHYGALKGKELAAKGKRYSFLIQYIKTGFKFFKAYIMRLGILDGRRLSIIIITVSKRF